MEKATILAKNSVSDKWVG